MKEISTIISLVAIYYIIVGFVKLYKLHKEPWKYYIEIEINVPESRNMGIGTYQPITPKGKDE